MKRYIAVVLTIFAVLAVSDKASFALEAEPIISAMQARYEKISTVTAVFTQEVSTQTGGVLKSEGEFFFKKPGRMKWLYTMPEKDVVVSNGKTLWVFQPDLNQVIEKPMEAGAGALVISFLSGLGELKDEFDITLAAVNDDAKNHVLNLEPKKTHPGIKRMTMELDKKTLIVVKTVVQDHLGNTTAITFSGIKTDIPLKDSFFEYKPPKGAAVVRP
ncbi:MAG: outer membrane lipoprotein chaperone LolA [Deltaproteobacteria bacterium]|nr:outer membrane lipoprotein chaperone LolA [Deltaproteobacteria bacterium]